MRMLNLFYATACRQALYIKADDLMSTIADVASLAGVSPSTVSRVLSGKASTLVSEATQRRVHEAARQLGYHPSAAARALATGRSNTVALCCYPVYDSAMAQYIQTVHSTAKEAGYHLLLVDHNETEEISELLAEQRVDAVVWTRYPLHEADELVNRRGAPHQVIIAIGELADIPPQKIFSAAWSDRQGMRLLLQHLAELGHRHVALLGGSPLSCPSKPRAFERECIELGLQGEIIRIDDETDRRAAGRAMAAQVLQRQDRPTALIGRHNDFALGAIHALQKAGLAVPDEMSVTGYHDGPEASYADPPLTSVHTPELIGVSEILPLALDCLKGNNTGQIPPTCLPLDVKLIIRASTAPVKSAI